MIGKINIDVSLLKRVISLGYSFKSLFIFCLVLAIVMAPVSVLRPYIINLMVENHILIGDLPGMYKMAVYFVIVLILSASFRYLFTYYSALLGQSIICDLRIKVFNHINKLRLRYFDLTPIGKSTTRTINDIETINNIFTQGLLTMSADILAIFAVIGIMFYTNWRLTLVCLAILPLLIIATYIFKEKVKKSFQRVRNKITTMNAFLQERITGMHIVQIFNAEKQEMGKFRKINRDYTQAYLDSILYYAVFFPVVEIIEYLTLALIVWLGAGWFLEGNVGFGAIVVFPMYVSMLFRPIRMLADKFNTIQMGFIAAERVFKVLDNDERILDIGQYQAQKLIGNIKFNNVHFSYDEELYVLHGINFNIKSGETLAIVGSTGSGKSTIINLLNRFYDIQRGEILVDGINIKEYKLEFLRSKLAMVLQDVFLFTGTVLENITLKDKRISREQAIEASKIIGADPYITSLPNGYDSIVSERGGNLSMGQRQLISFVRALVFDPNILILDEATSSIDTETESVIQYAIEKLIEKRTSIIIAHRLSTIRHADKILVMGNGKVLEYGSHNELLKNPMGRYRELYDKQYTDFLVTD